ncbi:MAG: hypothetical protein ABI670_20410 [Chloroflexota bacterium]
MPENRQKNRPPGAAPPGNNGHNAQNASRTGAAGKERPGSSFAARFGRIILQHGIAAIPSALYHYQGRMKLKIQHVWFVSYILSHKWDEDLPYPSLKKMSRATGIDLRYLQRLRSDLCSAGYLEVGVRHSEERGQETNTYDFSGLFERLEDLIVGDPPRLNPIQEETPVADLTEIAEVDSSFVARFGRIIVRRGVAAVPRAVFAYQAALGLTLQQVWFIAYIFSFQWDSALPYPSLEKMAEHTGYSRTHLHEIKSGLVEKGYLRLIPRTNVQGGRDSNAYDFSGLLDAIRAHLQAPADQTGLQNIQVESSHSSEIPNLRRSGRATISSGHEYASESPGGQERTGRGGVESTGRDGQGSTWGGGQKRTGRGGQQNAEGSGQEKTGRSGQQDTSHVANKPLHRTVNRLHKEEAVYKEPDQDDSNQQPQSKKISPVVITSATDSRPPYSMYIAQVASDFSQELQDAEHIVSNVTQALRLWQSSGLDEHAFVQVMYEAKTRTRKYQTRPHWDALNNKMSYFFKVLRDLVQSTGIG